MQWKQGVDGDRPWFAAGVNDGSSGLKATRAAVARSRSLDSDRGWRTRSSLGMTIRKRCFAAGARSFDSRSLCCRRFLAPTPNEPKAGSPRTPVALEISAAGSDVR